MKFEVQIESHVGAPPVTVDFGHGPLSAAAIQSGSAFVVNVDNRRYMATWQKTSATLILAPIGNGPDSAATDDNVMQLQIPIGIRTIRFQRFDGESETQCEMEILVAKGSEPSAPESYKASILKLLPGMTQASRDAAARRKSGLKSPILRSQITGKIISVMATSGAIVEQGEPLMVIEAMKMENRILAPARVKINAIKVQVGATVSTGDELVHMELADQSQA